jgi:HEPN domain-containing protein
MTQQDTIQFWFNSSLDDLKTAKAMLAASRYNYAMFMCQQALEELLKAIIVAQTNGHPPFIHDLVTLSQKINLKIPKHISENLKNINPHYIAARYKIQRFDPKLYNHISAKKTIQVTEKTIKWFIKKMELKKY